MFGHWPKIDHMNASNVNEGGILPTFPLRILVQTSFPSYSQLLGFETTKHSTFIIRKAAPLPSGWSGTKQLKRPYSPLINKGNFPIRQVRRSRKRRIRSLTPFPRWQNRRKTLSIPWITNQQTNAGSSPAYESEASTFIVRKAYPFHFGLNFLPNLDFLHTNS